MLADVKILKRWIKNNLPKNIRFAISLTGYSNDDIAPIWLEHFQHHSKKSKLEI